MASKMEVQGDRLNELKNMYSGQDMASCFAHLHLKMEGEVNQLKVEVAGVKSEVKILEARVTQNEEKINTINNVTMQEVADSMTSESRNRMKIDVWGRKWNLIIRGIDEGSRELGRDTLTKVKSFFKDTLKVSDDILESMQFAACHRLPGGPDAKKNIIVRFVSLLDRDDVLALAMKLPAKSGYSVVPDLPPELAEVRHKLLLKRKDMPADEKKNFKLVYLKDYPFVALKPKTK